MYLETTGGSIKFNILNVVLLDRDLPDNIKDFVSEEAVSSDTEYRLFLTISRAIGCCAPRICFQDGQPYGPCLLLITAFNPAERLSELVTVIAGLIIDKYATFNPAIPPGGTMVEPKGLLLNAIAKFGVRYRPQ